MERFDDPTAIERLWMTKMSDYCSGDCLSGEVLLELVERGRRARSYQTKMEHIAVCRRCRSTLKELRAVEALRRGARTLKPERHAWQLPRWAWAVAAPVAVAVAVFGFVALKGGFLESAPRNTVVHEDLQDISAPQPSGNGAATSGTRPSPEKGEKSVSISKPRPRRTEVAYIRITPSGVYEGRTRVTPFEAELIKVAMAAPPLDSMRSVVKPVPQQVKLIVPNPGNKGLLQANPEISWEPVEGAVGYDMKLEQVSESDGLGETIEGALEVTGTRAVPSPEKPLERGRIYRFMVRPSYAAEDIRSASLVEYSKYVFRILSQEESERAERALERAEKTPVASALVLHKLGLYAEAARIMPGNLENSNLRKWREQMALDAKNRVADPSR
jgi:hypothetical protein